MDTDEVVLWVCLGVAVLLAMLFLVFAVTTGGIKAFALYVLFPLFIISFLVGMVLLVQLIIKLNDKLDNSTSGLNKKIDTNNFMIKDTIVNVDDFLQNVDYTVIIEDRNIQIDPNNPEDYGTPFRYKPKIYEPSLEIPGVTGPEGLKDVEILSEENIKSVGIENPENIENITVQHLNIKEANIEENIIEEEVDEFSIAESLSVDETVNDSLQDSLSVNETIIEDSEFIFSFTEDDNVSINSDFCIENIFEIKPLHEEFLESYNLFSED